MSQKNVVAQSMSMLTYAQNAMTIYGTKTLIGRGFPDYRDGLAAVSRRILLSMYNQGLMPGTAFRKSAKTVGDVLGKYHPHGDAGTYGAMVTLASKPEPLVEGSGNWGNIIDGSPAAAYRYTEARLSKLAATLLFDPDYLEVVPTRPTFDNLGEEYVYLPAKLPILLINGFTAIGVAYRGACPNFTSQSVKEAVLACFAARASGTKLTANQLIELLTLDTRLGGGVALFPPDDWLQFVTTGNVNLKFTVGCKRNSTQKYISINSLPQGMEFTPKVIERLSDHQTVTSVNDMSKGGVTPDIRVYYKPRADFEQLQALTDHINKVCTTTNVIDLCAINSSENDEESLLRYYSVIEFLEAWCDWRVQLEVDYLNNQLAKMQSAKDLLDLRLWVCQNRDAVLAALKAKDSNAYLEKNFGLSAEAAKYVLGMTLQSITSASEDKLLADIERMNANIRQTEHWTSNVETKIVQDLNAGSK